MSELVARADDEFVKREAWIEFRIKWALLHLIWPQLRFHGFRGLRLTKGYAALNNGRFARLVSFGHNDLGLDGFSQLGREHLLDKLTVSLTNAVPEKQVRGLDDGRVASHLD
jgi:hypothetical protein